MSSNENAVQHTLGIAYTYTPSKFRHTDQIGGLPARRPQPLNFPLSPTRQNDSPGLPSPGSPNFKELSVQQKISAVVGEIVRMDQKLEDALKCEKPERDESYELALSVQTENESLRSSLRAMREEAREEINKLKTKNSDLQAQVNQQAEMIAVMKDHMASMEQWIEQLSRAVGTQDDC
eukprot:Rmarinus@m.17177